MKIYDWLRGHRFIHILLILIYYILVVAPHKMFGTFLNTRVFKGITRDQYNLYVISVATAILALLALVLTRRLRNHPERKKLSLYFICNTILSALVINLLFVINIEVIHFPQYAMFAILIFPLIGTYTGTLVWATIGGMLDEAYQYFYLAPKDTSYYDLNDVVTNLVGAVFGLLILAVFQVKEYTTFRLRSSSIWIGIGVVTGAIILTHLTGYLSIYPSEVRPYHILREWPPGFWSKVHPNVTFHVMRPIEGLLITVALWIFYSKIGPTRLSHET